MKDSTCVSGCVLVWAGKGVSAVACLWNGDIYIYRCIYILCYQNLTHFTVYENEH